MVHRLKISKFPAYTQLLKLGKDRPGALYLELACCVGNDLRKAIADGFPLSQAIASDLHPGKLKRFRAFSSLLMAIL